jgi:hypothetical protein
MCGGERMSRFREILRKNARVESLFVQRPVRPKEFFEIYLSDECRHLPMQHEELCGLELRFAMQKFIDPICRQINMREAMIDEFIAQFKHAVFGDAIERVKKAKNKLKYFGDISVLECFRELEQALDEIVDL